MEQFYIEDYIGVIVICIFVFFVIVGYVADKTGLARKTFGKTPSDNNKKLNSLGSNEVGQAVPAFGTDNSVSSVMDSADVELPVGEISNEILEPSAGNLYLSDNDIYSTSSEDTSNGANKLYLNNESIENNMDEKNSEEDLYQPLGDITFDTNETEKDHQKEVQNEDVWQLNDNEQIEANDDNLVLPNLGELNAEKDEDVWKF